jgi:DNA-binding response OmpR family regulator
MEYTVLIIDSDPGTHKQLGEYLTLSGFRVHGARDGLQGAEMLQALKPNIVLLDMQLPRIDGFQLLQRMQASSVLKQITVLFMSKCNRPNLKVKSLEKGADDFISKPFSRAEVLARIKVAIRRSHQMPAASEAPSEESAAPDSPDADSGVMTGHLENLTMAELLQTLEAGKKNATVLFPEIFGEVNIVDGAVVHAEQGAFQDEEAMVRLLFLDKGSFTVKFGKDALPRGREYTEINYQLLDCLVNLDTIREVLSALPEEDPVIDDFKQLPSVQGKDVLKSCLPCPLSELLVMLPGNLVANAELFVQQYRILQESSS